MGDAAMSDQVSYDKVKVGDDLPPLSKGPLTREWIKKYADASGDHNPIHIDEKTAIAFGFPSVIAHGMLNMGFVAQHVANWAGLDGFLKRIKVRFGAIVKPGDTVTCKGKIKDKKVQSGKKTVSLELWAENQKNEKVITGEAEVQFE
jgi:acyl dehydratase